MTRLYDPSRPYEIGLPSPDLIAEYEEQGEGYGGKAFDFLRGLAVQQIDATVRQAELAVRRAELSVRRISYAFSLLTFAVAMGVGAFVVVSDFQVCGVILAFGGQALSIWVMHGSREQQRLMAAQLATHDSSATPRPSAEHPMVELETAGDSSAATLRVVADEQD